MPSSAEILGGLSAVSNDWRGLAIAWHLAFAVMLVMMWRGWRPSNRVFSAMLTLPLLSVAVMAGIARNPFNLVVFTVGALALLALGRRLPAERVRAASPLIFVVGALVMSFGWAYPHFLQTGSWLSYVYAAPLGLIPCPTLSAVIGLTLIAGLFRSRPWALTLTLMGLMYGAIGAFRLGVALDYALIVAALVLGLATVRGASDYRSVRPTDAIEQRKADAA